MLDLLNGYDSIIAYYKLAYLINKLLLFDSMIEVFAHCSILHIFCALLRNCIILDLSQEWPLKPKRKSEQKKLKYSQNVNKKKGFVKEPKSCKKGVKMGPKVTRKMNKKIQNMNENLEKLH